jgi:hypothetical protein
VTNSVYPLWKNALMTEVAVNKSLDQLAPNNCAVALLTIGSTGGYNYSDNHQYYTDLTAIVGTPAALPNPVLTSNVFSAGGIVFTAVTGTAIGGFSMYRQNGGATSTWRLVLYEDTGIVGLPMIPNGGNLIVTWPTQGIFAL